MTSISSARGAHVPPSLSGRLVEVQNALRLLRDALVLAAREERTRNNDAAGDERAWVNLEQASGEVGAAEKSVMDAVLYVEAARTRGFPG